MSVDESTNKKVPLYRALVSAVVARANCEKNGNTEWEIRHRKRIEVLCARLLPSGSGLDNGCQFDLGASNEKQLVIHTAFHHMNDMGMYDGWTNHTVRVRASLLSEIDVTVSGRDRNGVKDYIGDRFDFAMRELVDEGPE